MLRLIREKSTRNNLNKLRQKNCFFHIETRVEVFFLHSLLPIHIDIKLV